MSMTSSINLPKTPTVEARNKTIVVVFRSGKEIEWDTMETREEAIKIAKELEVELRAVNYVQRQVHDFISEMRDYLASLNIDDGLLDSILIDGHAFARSQLNQRTVDAILMGADRGLRKEVLENLTTEQFIV